MVQIIDLQEKKTAKAHHQAIKQAPVTLISRFETDRMTYKNLSEQIKLRERYAEDIGRYLFQKGFIEEDHYAVADDPERIGVEMRLTFFTVRGRNRMA